MASLNFPANPADGDFYEGFQYDGSFGVWKRVGGSGAASMTVSETPPTQGLTSGAMWLDSTTGNTYIYYEDGNTSQWIQSSGPEVVPNRNSEFFIQTTPPAAAVDGDVWYDPSEGFTYIYYVDADSEQWIQFGLNRNGADGASGADGTNGSDGVGVPAGGTEGQVLSKSSNADYATEWIDSTSGFETIKLNGQTITENYTIPAGYNGLSAGPITIADGVSVTIPDGSAWSIV